MACIRKCTILTCMYVAWLDLFKLCEIITTIKNDWAVYYLSVMLPYRKLELFSNKVDLNVVQEAQLHRSLECGVVFSFYRVCHIHLWNLKQDLKWSKAPWTLELCTWLVRGRLLSIDPPTASFVLVANGLLETVSKVTCRPMGFHLVNVHMTNETTTIRSVFENYYYYWISYRVRGSGEYKYHTYQTLYVAKQR